VEQPQGNELALNGGTPIKIEGGSGGQVRIFAAVP